MDGIIITVKGAIVEISQAFCTLYGIPDEKIMGMNPTDLIHPEDRDTALQRMNDILKGELTPESHTYRLLRVDGSIIWAEVRIKRIEWKGKPALQIIVRDITVRRKSEIRQAISYRIADAANRSTNLEELSEYIRHELGYIIDTSNFYIALCDASKELVSFPYYFDETFPERPALPTSRKFGKGLTEYVIKSGRSLLANNYEIEQMAQEGKIELIGAPSLIWLGVTLKIKEKIIGIVAVQNYTNPEAYTEDDMELLEFVSGQIAAAIERKRREEILSRLVAIVESSDGAIIGKDLNGTILSWNAGAEKLYGYSAGEIIGKSMSILFPPERSEELTKILKKIRCGESIEHYETTRMRKGGRKIDISLTISTIRDSSGTIIGASTIAYDITKRKKAEEVLRKSEEKFRSLIENSSDIILIVNKKGVITYVSPSIERFLGYKPEELIGVSGFDFILPLDLPRAIYDFGRAILTKDVIIPNSFRVQHKDGSEHILEGVGKNLLDDSAVMGFVMNVRDVGERKRAEEALRKSEQRLKEAQALGRIGNWEFDIATQKIEWSDEVYELYERDKTLSPPSAEEEALYYPTEEAKRLREFARLAIEEGKESKYDLTATLPSGKTVFFNASMCPVKDDGGRVIKLFGTVQDITERKRAEEKLSAIHKMAEELALSLDIPQIINTALDIVQSELEYNNCEVSLVDGEKQELHAMACRGLTKGFEGRRESLEKKGIVNWVARNGQSLLIPDVSKDDRYDEWTPNIESELCVPLKIKEKTIGVLNVESEKMNAFSEEDKMLLETLASEAAIAIQNAMSFQNAQKELEERKRIEEKISAINKLSHKISQTFNMREIANIMLEASEKILGFGNTDIFLLDNEKQELYTFARRGIKTEILKLPLDGKGITVSCVREGETIYIPDVIQDERYIKESESTLSELSVPMKVKDKVIGVFDIERTFIEGFSDEDIMLAETLASSAAVAMQNAMLYEETQRRIADMAALNIAFHDIESRIELQNRLKLIIEYASSLLSTRGGGLYLFDKNRGELELVVSHNLGEDFRGTRLLPGEGLAGRIFLTRKPFVIDDYSSWEEKSQKYEKARFKSVLGVPIIWENETIGVVEVVEDSRTKKFSKQDINLLENFANTAAAMITTSRLYEEIKRNLEEISTIHASSKAISSVLDLKNLLKEIATIAQQNFGYNTLALLLVDEKTNEIYFAEALGGDKKFLERRFRIGEEGIVGRVASEGVSQFWNDVSQCPYYIKGGEEIKSEITVPLKIKEKVVGVFDVQSEFVDGLKERDLRIIEALGAQISIAIENAKLYEELKRSNLQLEFINDLMSHDLSNINQIALGNIEMLSGSGLSERQRRFLISAKNAVRRSARLVGNVKALKMMLEQKEEKEEEELSSLIEKAMREISDYPGKSATIEYAPRQGQFILADNYLPKAFGNLLDNAMKFTPHERVRVAVEISEEEKTFRIKIKDWGKGISDDMKKDIFQRYEKLSEGKLGTGLGLYATKKIVENHSGKIWVEDNPEGGSVFCVEIPKVVG